MQKVIIIIFFILIKNYFKIFKLFLKHVFCLMLFKKNIKLKQNHLLNWMNTISELMAKSNHEIKIYKILYIINYHYLQNIL